ncbi:MAG TPA: hypothetical protein VK867_01345 [Candidatus Limnocylindrales bacterium]|nr:hypothetical protein [Candidatus Limnocylindrales bacterium]
MAITLAGLLSLTAAGAVAAHGPDPILGGSLWTQNQALQFRWRSGSEPPAAIRTAILAAAKDSNDSRASRAATFGYDSTSSNPIGYGTGTCGVNGLGCFTRSAPTGFTMWLREHGRVFDWGTLRWCQMLSSPTNGCYDAETIALDEFGHVEILDHHLNHDDDRDYTDAVVQTFSRTRAKTGWDMHEYGPCDTATLQLKYDVPLAASPYSTCLDLATVLTLSANDTSIPYNGSVTMTAALKVATDSAYGRVSANAVSGRTVRLQRRALGSSTWAAFTTLNPTTPTGSYVASFRLTATADFRAVFSTPSSEGLRGDTSPTVRITVAPCTANCPDPLTAG